MRDEWNPAQILSLEKQFTVLFKISTKASKPVSRFHSFLQNHSIQENTAVTELNASDPDGDFLSYSILHGDDANALVLTYPLVN